MLLSGASLSILGLLGKIGLQHFSLPSLIFWRFFAAFLLCLIWAKKKGKVRLLSFKQLKLNALRAILVLGSQYSYFYLAETTSLLQATIWINMGPLFVPLLEKIFLRQNIGKSTSIGLIVAFAGALCVLQPSSEEIFSLLDCTGILTGLLQAASQIVFAMGSAEEKSSLPIVYLFFFCSIFSALPYQMLAPSTVPIQAIPYSVWACILALGLASAVNQLSRAEAYQLGSPGKLAVFLYVSVPLATLWDFLLFHNQPNLLSLIGSLLVIVGGALKFSLHQRSHKRKNRKPLG